MEKMKKYLPVLLLAAALAVAPALEALACGGGGMDHGNMGGSSGMMGSGTMMSSPGHTGHGMAGQGMMGQGMMGGANAPAGAWAPPGGPSAAGSGHMGPAGSMDHGQMDHRGHGHGQ